MYYLFSQGIPLIYHFITEFCNVQPNIFYVTLVDDLSSWILT